MSVYLAEARMTQKELAHTTNVSAQYTNQVLSGKKPASQRWLELVAEHLNVPSKIQKEWIEDANTRRQRSKLILPPYNKGDKT